MRESNRGADTLSAGTVSDEILLQIDGLCSDFEDNWVSDSACQNMAAMFEEFQPVSARGELLFELICVDCELRGRQHLEVSASGFHAAFPAMSDHVDKAFDRWAKFESRSPALTDHAALQTQPEVIGGNRIVREIGRGGTSIVFEAIQPRLHRRVAIKTVAVSAARLEEQRQRFELEARAVSRLEHPHIIPIYESGIDDGVMFYVMQYVGGGSLAELVSAQQQKTAEALILLPRRAAQIVADAAEALQFAHQNNVLHRDIKPSNLLLDQSGTVRLADFGLARLTNSDTQLTETGDVVGSLRYLPPEAFDGLRDERSDVYGLGVTLYELLTLQPAFPQKERSQLIRSLTEFRVRSPAQINAGIPRDLDTITMKAMAFDPADRYASAADLCLDLRKFLAGHPIDARPASTIERVWKWMGRHPTTTALSALLLVVIAVSVPAVLLLWQGRILVQERADRDLAESSLRESQFREQALSASAVADQERRAATKVAKARAQAEYAMLVNGVQTAINAGNISDAAIRMQRYERDIRSATAERAGSADPRDWEWRYLQRLVDEAEITIRTGDNIISSLSLSPDESHFATVGLSEDGICKVRLFDANDGRLLRTLPATKELFSGVTFSPDGKILATVSYNSPLDELVMGTLVAMTTDPVAKKILDSPATRSIIDADPQLRLMMEVLENVGPEVTERLVKLDAGLIRFLTAVREADPEELKPGELLNRAEPNVQSLFQDTDHKQITKLADIIEGTPGWVRLWEVSSGKLLQSASLVGASSVRPTINIPSERPRIQYASDDVLITSSPVAAFAARDLQPIWDCPGDQSLCFPNHVAVFHENTVRLLDLATGQPLTEKVQTGQGPFDLVPFRPHRLAFDDSACSYLSFHGEKFFLRQIQGSELIQTQAFGIPPSYWAMTTPDGLLVRSEFTGRIVFQRLEAGGEVIRELNGHLAGPVTGSFSKDGRRLLTADEEGAVRIWNLSDVEPSKLMKVAGMHDAGSVEAMTFDKTGDRLHFANSNAVPHTPKSGWISADGRQHPVSPIDTTYYRMSPRQDFSYTRDGSLLAAPAKEAEKKGSFERTSVYTQSGRIHVWSTETGAILKTMEFGPVSVTALTWSFDQQHLAVATLSEDTAAARVAVMTVGELPLDGSSDSVHSMQARPIRWLEAGQEPVESLRFVPAGDQLIVSSSAGLFLVSTNGTQSAQLIDTPERPSSVAEHEIPTSFVDVAADGSRFATVVEGDIQARVYDLVTREILYTAEAPPDVCSLQFSPNGRRLAMAGRHNNLYLLDAESGHRLLMLECDPDHQIPNYGSPIQTIFSPDGRRLAMSGSDGHIKVWDVGAVAVAHPSAPKFVEPEQQGVLFTD